MKALNYTSKDWALLSAVTILFLGTIAIGMIFLYVYLFKSI